jgi:hypothetical protein
MVNNLIVNTNPQSQLEGGSGSGSTAPANFNDLSETPREPTYNETLRNNPVFPVANKSQSAGNSPSYPSSPWQQATGRSPTDLPSNSSAYTVTHDHSSPYGPPQDQSRDHVPSPRSHQPYSSGESTKFPLEDPQEACLLRYFVEELSHWVPKIRWKWMICANVISLTCAMRDGTFNSLYLFELGIIHHFSTPSLHFQPAI